jgi:hypothetical protein
LLICFITLSPACHSYNPALYPSYDVLNPGPEVRANPLGFAAQDPDGTWRIEWGSDVKPSGRLSLVDQAFMTWALELKEEVKKLRAELEKK